MKTVLEDLKQIVNSQTRKYPMPYKSGNCIRIGHLAIRYSKKNGYIIFDCLVNKSVCKTYSKFGAFAVSKLYLDNKSIENAVYLDTAYQKHKNDIVFYKHIIQKQPDNLKKEILRVRLEISEAYLNNAINDLEKIIFSER